MNKADIRSLVVERRSRLLPHQVALLSTQIADRLLQAAPWRNAMTIHIYTSRSVAHEVDTTIVLQRLMTLGLTLTITTGEPRADAPQPLAQYDAVIVPLVAFDTSLHRIGYGGGWYDRFLVKQTSALKIGLAFNTQQVTQIVPEPHDVKLDMIITETNVFSDTQDY